MPKGRFNSIEAEQRHRLASSRGGQARVRKGFAVAGDPASAGRRSGEARRRPVSKETPILDRSRTEMAS
jgi:hypothetical protein